MANIKQMNRFVSNPLDINMQRSRFPQPFEHKGTMKSGRLVPFYINEIVPGDTVKMNLSSVFRMITPAVPVMDNAYIDFYFFFVPFRLATAHDGDWQKICGENMDGPWANEQEYTLENTGNTINFNGEVKSQSFLDYIGVPVGTYTTPFLLNQLPSYSYLRIFNEWFRNENVTAPYTMQNCPVDFKQDCLKPSKFPDYFTSCLPAPQKGNSVLLPLQGLAPVLTGDDMTDDKLNKKAMQMHYVSSSSGTWLGKDSSSSNLQAGGSEQLFPSNLYADLSQVSSATINELRLGFALQRILEKDARGGSRYIETLQTHFHVNPPQGLLQRTEYIYGKRVPLNITQVLQTSETSEISPLGTVGAFSNTSQSDYMFTKSFVEYGYLMGICCIRPVQTYGQGLPRFLFRNRRFDYYWPALANIGEQAVLKKELVLQTDSVNTNEDVFGYQEAWAEYRYKPNKVSGALNPGSGDKSFMPWTFTSNFDTSSAPVLNEDFIYQDSQQIGDSLVVTTTDQQFVFDIYCDVVMTRPMPLWSIPGLIDHF